MLEDKNRIFQNLYGDKGIDVESSKERGDWTTTKDICSKGKEWIINEIKASELRGRGGAGFPTGVKWSFAPKEASKPHYLVINADESEPGTCKDRDILRFEPQKLIEGCLIASYAVNAHTCYIYIRGEYFKEGEILQKSIDEAYRKNFRKGGHVNPQKETLFNQRLAEILKHNANPHRKYSKGVNEFTDVPSPPKGRSKPPSTELSKKHALDIDSDPRIQAYLAKSGGKLPETVDWRDAGIVSPVKNQGHCGSCWAFASTAVVESHVALATDKLYSLSPQQLVACAPNDDHCGGVGGCMGSIPELAYDYLIGAGGYAEADEAERNKIYPELSGKMEVLHNLMDVMWKDQDAKRPPDKIVVISVYTQTLDLVQRMCKGKKWPVVRLDGSLAVKKRMELVNAFNDVKNRNIALEPARDHRQPPDISLNHGLNHWKTVSAIAGPATKEAHR